MGHFRTFSLRCVVFKFLGIVSEHRASSVDGAEPRPYADVAPMSVHKRPDVRQSDLNP